MASGPITSWQIDEETMETMTDFIFGGSWITEDGDCSHEIKRCFLLERKVRPFASPGDLSNPGIEPRSPALQADSLQAELQGKPMTNLDSILKSIVHYFANKAPFSQSYSFSSSHVWMWELG